jgi:hypothetical protein
MPLPSHTDARAGRRADARRAILAAFAAAPPHPLLFCFAPYGPWLAARRERER